MNRIYKKKIIDDDLAIEADPIVSAMGTGRSKKDAKHAAAKTVLDKLIGVNSESTDAPLTNSIPE